MFIENISDMLYCTLSETRHSSVDLRASTDGWMGSAVSGGLSVSRLLLREPAQPLLLLSAASVWESGDHFHYLANRSWQPPPLSVLIRVS